uniref:Uncharacterized protein n=1 Tax=Ralstonia solanacearum TaxID=305 RepID=A0A0S4TSZ0_RALSL|nr:protein of unknown function [Ralstonia solanacearum]
MACMRMTVLPARRRHAERQWLDGGRHLPARWRCREVALARPTYDVEIGTSQIALTAVFNISQLQGRQALSQSVAHRSHGAAGSTQGRMLWGFGLVLYWVTKPQPAARS